MSRDVVHFATSKLAGDWSAPDFSKFLNPDTLTSLTGRFESLDPLVRVRLLLSALSLPQQAQQEMRPQLLELADAAVADKEEWVHIIGRSVGRLEGQLDLQGVLQESTVVRDTVAELRHRLEATGAEQASTSNFRPLEEAYLSRRLVGGALPSQGTHRQHAHFLLRDGAVPVSPQRPQQVVAAAVATAAAAIPSPTDQAAIGQPSAMSSGASGRTLQHTQSGATSGSARRGTALATDMFRSSRPATLSRPPAAVTAHATPGHDQRERKGAARMVKAKIIDVNEAIQLHKQMAQEKDKGHMADKDEAGPSTDAAAAPMSPRQQLHSRSHSSQDDQTARTALTAHAPAPAPADEDAEEGELEAGELPEATHDSKRARTGDGHHWHNAGSQIYPPQPHANGRQQPQAPRAPNMF